eukprot:gene21820-28846_t
MEGGSSGIPIRTKIYARNIGGLATDFSFSIYQNQVMLIVTQLGAVGTVMSVARDSSFDGGSTFTSQVMMGRRDEPMLPLCARRIGELANSQGCSKAMIVCLGLKEASPAVLKEIEKVVAADNAWS